MEKQWHNTKIYSTDCKFYAKWLRLNSTASSIELPFFSCGCVCIATPDLTTPPLPSPSVVWCVCVKRKPSASFSWFDDWISYSRYLILPDKLLFATQFLLNFFLVADSSQRCFWRKFRGYSFNIARKLIHTKSIMSTAFSDGRFRILLDAKWFEIFFKCPNANAIVGPKTETSDNNRILAWQWVSLPLIRCELRSIICVPLGRYQLSWVVLNLFSRLLSTLCNGEIFQFNSHECFFCELCYHAGGGQVKCDSSFGVFLMSFLDE